MSTIRLEHALLEDGVADDVLLEIEGRSINSVRVHGQSMASVGCCNDRPATGIPG